MKVLLINGSPRKAGNTFRALTEVANTLESLGVDSEIVHIGPVAVQGCIACFRCKGLGRCVFNDRPYIEVREKLESADGLVVGSPVYYAGPNGSLCALLDRLFFSSKPHLQYKPAAAVAVCRRGGASATFDRLNKYFTISEMPIVSSRYWNQLHGNGAEEAEHDLEGMHTMRTLGKNMAFLIKCIRLGKEQLPPIEKETKVYTNFIRKEN
jgi:multimeric flavodoxin WrbA